METTMWTNEMTGGTLNMSEDPPKLSTRKRRIKFTLGELIDILSDHCRANGIEIGDDCTRYVWGVECSGYGGDSVVLVIEGD